MRNALEEEKRRRTIEILKFRGTYHQKGEWPFTVTSGQGIVVLPLSAIELTQKSSAQRVYSGNDELDLGWQSADTFESSTYASVNLM